MSIWGTHSLENRLRSSNNAKEVDDKDCRPYFAVSTPLSKNGKNGRNERKHMNLLEMASGFKLDYHLNIGVNVFIYYKQITYSSSREQNTT